MFAKGKNIKMITVEESFLLFDLILLIAALRQLDIFIKDQSYAPRRVLQNINGASGDAVDSQSIVFRVYRGF